MTRIKSNDSHRRERREERVGAGEQKELLDDKLVR